jgi:hypothetical protein
MSDDLFDFVAPPTVQPQQTSNWIVPGKYTYEVQKLVDAKTTSGRRFIAELLVVESTSTGEVNRKTGQPFVPNPVGSIVALNIKLTGELKDPGPSNMLTFLLALLGTTKEKLTREKMRLMVSDFQPAAGLQIKDVAFNKPQKEKTTEDFTYHRWETVPQTDKNKAHIEAIKPKIIEFQKAQAAAAAKAAAEAAARAQSATPAAGSDPLGI